jgi:UDP:flavonoid glycosyltransferase YjiC (YdhE family)
VQRKLPWAGTVLAPLSFMSDFDPPLISGAEWFRGLRALGPRVYGAVFGLLKWIAWPWEAPLRKFRAELGLPPLAGMALFEGQFSPHLNLGLFDPPLAAPQRDWPARTQVTGAPLHDGAAPGPDAGELEAFLAEGAPPIVFALGSSAIFVAGDDFWRSAAEAARRLGRRAILVAGAETARRLSLPPGVRAFGYLPYSTVFPRAAAIVHQAGIGTLAQALRSGRPQLIVPFAFDQPDNARRAVALGCARTLPLKKVSVESLATELKFLLEEPRYAQRAGALAAELRPIDGAARAADALCTLL